MRSQASCDEKHCSAVTATRDDSDDEDSLWLVLMILYLFIYSLK